MPGLPHTDNDPEYFFGTARQLEWRTTGHKRASLALVVRVIAAGASRLLSISVADFRQTLAYRQEERRRQRRFRRNLQTYLASLEERLCRSGLRS